MMMNKGKTVLVTGATSGLGRNLAKALTLVGYSVAINGRSTHKVDEVVGELEETGAKAIGAPADVSDPDQVAHLFQSLPDLFGLINNAAVDYPVRLAEATNDQIQDILSINVKGVLLCSKHAAASMQRRGIKGRIINTSSWVSERPYFGSVAYCASKAAVNHISRVLSLELARSKITVNTIALGSMDHQQGTRYSVRSVVAVDRMEGDPSIYRSPIPDGEYATAADYSNAVCFLLREEAQHITGVTLFVDGGQHLV